MCVPVYLTPSVVKTWDLLESGKFTNNKIHSENPERASKEQGNNPTVTINIDSFYYNKQIRRHVDWTNVYIHDLRHTEK